MNYIPGTAIRLSSAFKSLPTLALADPTTVKLLLLLSGGTETVLVYGVDAAVARTGAGQYQYDFVPAPGHWQYRWLGVGAPGTLLAGSLGTFNVLANPFSQ